MKCFTHQQKDAVGICKNCNKGICAECAVDVGNGLACKNSCEESVKAINEMIDRGKGVYKKTGLSYLLNAIVFGLFGFFFLFFGYFIENDLSSFMIPIGIIFLLGMAFMIYSGLKIKSKVPN